MSALPPKADMCSALGYVYQTRTCTVQSKPKPAKIRVMSYEAAID